ncbi:MAG: phytoene desaturase [Flavobacteriales bacterium]|nr:phytoene desaturase [Flavobacteriales bacterium]
MTQAFVIGSGVAGLAASIRLAVAGHAVQVFEQAPAPGGKLSVHSEGGYRFDRGPSLFTMPHLVEDLFTLAGVPIAEHFRYERLVEANRYFWQDGTRVTGWSDPLRFANELQERLSIDQETTLRYLNRATLLLESTGRTFLEHSLHRWETLREGGVRKALTTARWNELTGTLNDINRSAFKNEKAVQLFNRFATYNGSSPYKTPGLMRMISGLEHGQGAFYPEGGMHSITRALHQLAVMVGVRFHFNSPVERILLNPGLDRVTGIRVDGQELNAPVVVSAIDIVPTYRQLLPDLPAPKRTLAQERSSSALVFYWGVKTVHPELGLHNILFSNDYTAEFEHLFEKGQVYRDPTVYINITSTHTPSDAPAGCSNWFTMINAPRQVGQDREAMVQSARAAVLAKVQRTLGFDVENFIEVEQVLDPKGIEELTGSYQGSIYGTSSNSPWAAFLRHPNFHPRVEGLYFCGGSVHPGGGIPLALHSARIATSMIERPPRATRPNSV